MNKTFSRMLYKAKKTTDKVVEVVSDNSGNILNTVGNAVNDNIALAKLVTSCAVLEGEISELYEKLGESVFMDGLTPENETAMYFMNTLFVKTKELEDKRIEYNSLMAHCKNSDNTEKSNISEDETSEISETSENSGSDEVSNITEDETQDSVNQSDVSEQVDISEKKE